MAAAQHHDRAADQQIMDTVQRHGWFVALFMGTRYLPSFAYTIGLWRTFGHPELIAFGLTTEALHRILNLAGEKVRAGATIRPGQLYRDIFDDSVAGFVRVDEANLNDYMAYGVRFNSDSPFDVLQLVWTDRAGRFPWHEAFDKEFTFRQPVLDRPRDFKFYADRLQDVVTCAQHIDMNEPVSRVRHDRHGAWRFLTKSCLADDLRQTTLGAMVKADPSLNELFDLDEGYQAEKTERGWIRSKIVFAQKGDD